MKRYEFVGGDGPCAYPQEEPEGRMVAYVDHANEVAALRQMLRKAAAALENCRDYTTASEINNMLEASCPKP